MANDALRTEISHLTLAISEHQNTLNELRARRKALQSRLDSIVYPILTLPPELTSEIFIQCLPPEEENEGFSLGDAPLVFTRVCAAWRRIALAMPGLWQRFSVNIDGQAPDALAMITETWLSRSGCCSLSIKISGKNYDATRVELFLSAFRLYTSRLEKLELSLPPTFIHEMDAQLSSSDFPRLQDLVLKPTINFALPVAAMFSEAPLLRNVIVSMAEPSVVFLPWRQLARFIATSYFEDECLDVLRLAPNLVFGRFEIIDSVGDDESDLIHDNLQHLEVIEREEVDFIRYLTLPALQTFHWARPCVDVMGWESFIQRSLPPLRKLIIEIQDGPAADFELPGAFARLPLTDVEIGRPYMPFVSSFLRLLGSDPSFLPQLGALRFADCRDFDDENTISELVQTAGRQLQDRWVASTSAQCARLMQFHVDISSEPSFEVLSKESLSLLNGLKKDGVDIRIGWSQYPIL